MLAVIVINGVDYTWLLYVAAAFVIGVNVGIALMAWALAGGPERQNGKRPVARVLPWNWGR